MSINLWPLRAAYRKIFYMFLNGQTVPTDKDERKKWFRGIDIIKKYSDKQINEMSTYDGYGIRFAKTAARFRKELIKHYGRKQGKKIRYAEAFELCAYGTIPDKEFENKLFWL